MNNSSEGHGPPETRFDIPDVSDLMRRTEELAIRARELNENMAAISRRIHEAIAISDEYLCTRRRPMPENQDQTYNLTELE